MLLKSYVIKKSKIKKTVFHIIDIATLKNGGKDPNIVITRTDKGKIVVILNKYEYLYKTNEILDDRTTF